jgi:hypothetical protein
MDGKMFADPAEDPVPTERKWKTDFIYSSKTEMFGL